MNDKMSTLIIALLGGAVGVLGVGAVTDANADPVASSQQPMVIRIESPAATAGGDVSGGVVKLSDVEGLCALGSKPASSGTGKGGSSSRSGSAVNSSGNSANVNTNAIALNNQIGLEQKTIVVQESSNEAGAVAEQGQSQGPAPDVAQEPTTTEETTEPTTTEETTEPTTEEQSVPEETTTTTTTTTTTLPPAEPATEESTTE